MNCTAEPRTISLDLGAAGIKRDKVKTLATDDASLKSQYSLKDMNLPPYASWIASVD